MKKIVFTFGRFNPPTIGHKKLIDAVVSTARKINADHRIYISHSQDRRKNPLEQSYKISVLRKLFPRVNIEKSGTRSLFSILDSLVKAGYEDVTIVAGSDRVPMYKKLFKRYAKDYGIDHVNVVSAGNRIGGSLVAQASGTKMREFVKNDDFTNFFKSFPNNDKKLARNVFNKVKMNLNEAVDLNEGLYDKHIFKAVFLVGGPGSGKDYILSKTIQGHGLKELNSDQAFEYIASKKNFDLKNMFEPQNFERDLIRSKAKHLTKQRESLYLRGRLGLIINGTGADFNKTKKLKDALERDGYDTMMIYVNTSNVVSKKRNIERGKQGGRTIPELIRRTKWKGVHENLGKYQGLFGQSNFIVIDNSRDFTNLTPKEISNVQNQYTRVFKLVNKFLSKEVSHHTTKDWIRKEKAMRQIREAKKTKYKKRLRKKQIKDENITYNTVDNADSLVQVAGMGKFFSAFNRIGEEQIKEYLRFRQPKGTDNEYK